MVSINYSSREVCCKIVYYGPGLSGKTTNLIYVHEKVPGGSRGDLISLATEADRTLYFDFLPINIGSINGFAAKFQLYTVPGQVYYNATRKLVLRGVDGVVFVADSQPDKMDENIDSLANLDDNLKEYGYDMRSMPFVLQYNKRDLPGVMSFDEMQAQLNPTGVPAFEASATLGTGVFDTLKMIIKLVLDKAKNGGESPAIDEPLQTSAAEEPVSTPEVSASSTGKIAQVSASDESYAPATSESSATATATVVKEETEEEDPDQYRPYPGGMSQKVNLRNSKISSASFAPAADESIAESPVENKVTNEHDDNQGTEEETLSAPLMAPSLKTRRERRKRGFFKRLFGIK